jgi:hypothetical protein
MPVICTTHKRTGYCSQAEVAALSAKHKLQREYILNHKYLPKTSLENKHRVLHWKREIFLNKKTNHSHSLSKDAPMLS